LRSQKPWAARSAMNSPYPCAALISRLCIGTATNGHGGPICRYRLSQLPANFGRPVRSR
jgi:hypothetical protein